MRKRILITLSLLIALALSAVGCSSMTNSEASGSSSSDASKSLVSKGTSSDDVSVKKSIFSLPIHENKKRGAITVEEPARTLYAEKVQEYLARYGVPSIQDTDRSTASWIQMRLEGLCVVELIDLAQDGTPELYLVYLDQLSEPKNQDIVKYGFGHYVTEVWEYSGDAITRVYQAETLEIANGGFSFSRVLHKPDGYVLIDDGYGEHPQMKEYFVYSYQDERLEITDSFGLEYSDSLDSTFYVEDTTGLTWDEFGDFYSEYFLQFDEAETLRWQIESSGKSHSDAIAGLWPTLLATCNTLTDIGV